MLRMLIITFRINNKAMQLTRGDQVNISLPRKISMTNHKKIATDPMIGPLGNRTTHSSLVQFPVNETGN